jgi:aerobic C4-dicarboxylate transport protein
MKPLADAFIKLIKMVIAPVIFCTVVVGIASLGNLRKAGRVGLKALGYFLAATLAALTIGLLVVNLVRPGEGVDLTVDAEAAKETLGKAKGSRAPSTSCSASSRELRRRLHQRRRHPGAASSRSSPPSASRCSGRAGEPIVAAIDAVAKVIFKIIHIIMYAGPGRRVRRHGVHRGVAGHRLAEEPRPADAVLLRHLPGFVFGVLGVVARLAGFNVFKFVRLIKDELLIVLGTSSSETVLPRIMAKLEASGASKPVVGLTIPTGYSFNLDGTCIYLTMGALFIAQATGQELSISQQIGLLLLMLLTSKGAAGVTGAGSSRSPRR